MAAAQDIRADIRVEAAFRVQYTMLDQRVVADGRDLSKSGMFLATTRFLPVNAVVRVQLELPAAAQLVPLIGRVAFVRAEEEAARLGQPAGMGMHFLDVSKQSLDAIGRFISVQSSGIEPALARARPLDVLVVDDYDDLCELTAIPLRARGDHVRSASNGVEALALCLRRRPDVILSDIAMPIMDGWQFLRVVRARPSLASIPIAFITALADEATRLRGFQLGVDDYVIKPFRPTELVARVDRLVARSVRLGGIDRKTLRGSIEHVPLTSVLSFLELEKLTGVLLVLRERSTARLFVREGRLLRIEVERGTAAAGPAQTLSHVLGWPMGEFEFAAQDVSASDEFGLSISDLLLEQTRLGDEKGSP